MELWVVVVMMRRRGVRRLRRKVTRRQGNELGFTPGHRKTDTHKRRYAFSEFEKVAMDIPDEEFEFEGVAMDIPDETALMWAPSFKSCELAC